MSRGSLSTTSLTPRVWVPRHVARHTTRLVVDYFAYAARLGASAPRATRRAACHATRRRLLRLHCAFGCLGTLRGSSYGSSLTTSLRAGSYTACPGASARRVARLAARRRLLRLRSAYEFLGTSRGLSSTTSPTPRVRVLGTSRGSSCGSSRSSSCRSSSTTSLTPHVHVPRHVARLVVYYFAYAARPVPRHVVRLITWLVTRLVTPLVVDYFTYAARPGASACRVARRRLLRLRRVFGCPDTSRGMPRGSSLTTSPMPHVWVPRHVSRLVAQLVVDYFASRRLVRHVSVCLGSSRGSSLRSSSTT
jgi:hypothetical protein